METGVLVIRRLHRLVRHGFRPWLGYEASGGQDGDIHLRMGRQVATLSPDGSVAFAPRPGTAAAGHEAGSSVIAGPDVAAFDARFPPNAPNRRNLVRRLYEIGFLAP